MYGTPVCRPRIVAVESGLFAAWTFANDPSFASTTTVSVFTSPTARDQDTKIEVVSILCTPIVVGAAIGGSGGAVGSDLQDAKQKQRKSRSAESFKEDMGFLRDGDGQRYDNFADLKSKFLFIRNPKFTEIGMERRLD